MKILHIVDEPYDSGIVNYALTAALGLKQRGHDVQVWGLPDKAPLAEAERLGLATAAIPGLTRVLSLRRLLRETAVDLINAHTGSSHTLAVALSRSTSPSPPVVRTRGDARPVRRTAGGELLWRRTAGFIAPSRRIVEQFHAAYPRIGVGTRTIYPGLDGALAPAEPPAPLRVALVGRLDPVKGHADFLRAAAATAAQFPDARFVVAGRDENVKASELEALSSNLGLRGRVEFLGHVPDARALMRRCHVGVIASRGSEAVSRAAVEWMSAGRPVVATAVGCLPEFVSDGEAGLLVPPEDPVAMGQAIESLLGDGELRRELGAGARRRFERLFALSRLVDETAAFYGEVLSGREPGR